MCKKLSRSEQLRLFVDYPANPLGDLHIDPSLDMYAVNDHIDAHVYGNYPIIFRSKTNKELYLCEAEWGVIPYYITDVAGFKRQRSSMINIRSERILDDTKSYWYKIRDNRCLIPATGFYEYREVKTIKGKKIPYHIALRNQPRFFLPGLYSLTETEEGKRRTFAIITRQANSVMRMIHNSGDNPHRMPLMLPVELCQAWLNETLTESEYRHILSYAMPSEELAYHTVFTIGGKTPRPDGLPISAEWQWENLPPLTEQL